MSNYVPHYTKKRQIQKRKELNLQRLVDRGAGEQELRRAADEVRAARIRTLQAKLATIPPADGLSAAQAANIVAKIDELSATTLEAVLAEFGLCQS